MIVGSIPIENKSKFKINFKLMHKIGFKSIDIRNLMDSKSEIYEFDDSKFSKFFIQLKNKLSKYNLTPYQMHGMWDTNLFELDKQENWNKLFFYYEKCMKACSILGTKYLVIHPRMPFGWETKIDQYEFSYKNNVNFIKKLLPIAKKYNVVLCLENMPSPFDFGKIDGIIKCVDEINDEYLKICFDIGHYNVIDNEINIFTILKKIGNRLKVLHIHDNNQDIDAHLLPGQGNIDWKSFFKGLNEIGYDGPLSLEAIAKFKNKRQLVFEEKKAINFIKTTSKMT